jgi:DNA-binding SARP family transcriptional activator
MEFRVLGRLEVWEGDRLLPLTPAKQRAILAVLLLYASHVVSVDRLIDELCEAPPKTAKVTLQNYLARLRRALQLPGTRQPVTEVLLTRAPGYLLRVEDDQMDLHQFERLSGAGRQALADNDPWQASEQLRGALSLWRGPAFADVAMGSSCEAEAARLEESRVSVLEDRIEADLLLGRHTELADELGALVLRHPLRERLYQ